MTRERVAVFAAAVAGTVGLVALGTHLLAAAGVVLLLLVVVAIF